MFRNILVGANSGTLDDKNIIKILDVYKGEEIYVMSTPGCAFYQYALGKISTSTYWKIPNDYYIWQVTHRPFEDDYYDDVYAQAVFGPQKLFAEWMELFPEYLL